ncbi:MAG: hypothetical protein IKA03_01440 [Alphaproteobacteria bacterium]|nr:hypothetical protein [Alphaproteobacteria bacterium]
MVEYQKFMFDNFIISCEEEPTTEDSLDVSVAKELLLSEEHSFSDDNNLKEDVFSVDEIIETTSADENIDGVIDQENVFESIPPIEDSINDEIKEPEVELKYSQEDMDIAINEAETRGRELGYSEGFAASSTENQKMQQSLLENIDSKLATLISNNYNNMVTAEETAIKVALEAIRKVLPSLEQDVAKKELVAFLGDNFSKFKNESSLSFSFHPQMIAEIAPQLSKLAEKHDFEGKISVHKDIDLGLSDCRIEWKNGGVERNTTKVLNKIEELIS